MKPRIWTRQPQGPIRLSNAWLRRGLVVAVIGGQTYEAATQKFSVWNGTASSSRLGFVNRGKAHVVRAADSTDYLKILSDADAQALLPTGDCTLVLHYKKTDGTARAAGAFGTTDSGGPGRIGAHLPYSDGNVYFDYGGATSGASRVVVTGPTFGDDVWAFTAGAHGMEVWQNGVLMNSHASAITRSAVLAPFCFGNHAGTGPDNAASAFFYIFRSRLSAKDIRALVSNPWQVAQPIPGRRRAFSVAAGGTHTTTGALAADAAVVAGTAAHLTLHTSTGALSAGAATVSGSATHLTLHTTTGALSAAAATIAGTAVHPHTTTGALSSAAATIAGTADNAAAGEHAATGALSAAAASVSGTAVHKTLHATTGALSASAATVAGTAAHLTVHTTTGALQAASATVSGAAIGPGGVAQLSVVGGGGFPARAEKGRRYGLLPPPTKEKLAALVKAQREALGILPKPAQKRIVSAVKKAAAKTDPSLQLLAPVVVEIAQTADLPAVDVARAVEQSFIYAQALRQARATIEAAQRQQQAQVIEQERQRHEAQEAEAARAQHMARLQADDEALLQFMDSVRGQAIEALRMAQQHLMSLIQ